MMIQYNWLILATLVMLLFLKNKDWKISQKNFQLTLTKFR